MLSEIMQGQKLYQVSFDSDFLEIYWLIELKVVLETKKQTRLESPLHRFLYVNGKQFKSNSDWSEKIPWKHMSVLKGNR